MSNHPTRYFFTIQAQAGSPSKMLTVSFFSIQHTSELKRGSNTIKATCRHMIQAKRDQLASQTYPGRDILSIAIASGGFSNDDLVNQLMTFLAAGHETSAAAMSWCLYELCHSSHIQHRIREEIRIYIPAQHFETGTNELNISREEFQATYIDRCAYLHAFCSEILRLYPPAPLTMRVAVRDTSIAETQIPKGTTIIIAPWAVNTSIELWGEDAHVFRPERWLSPQVERQQQKFTGPETPYAFLTFLHGPRSCIGQSFARAELACLVAAWVGAFETEFAEPEVGCKDEDGLYVAGVKLVTGISARPGGLKVRIRKV